MSLFGDHENNERQQAEELFTGIRLLLCLENAADFPFWRDVFCSVKAGLHKTIAYQAEFQEGEILRKGKTALENLWINNCLGSHKVACPDSDWDFLLEKPFLDGGREGQAAFIFQTYVYSIESYQCLPANLSDICIEASLHPHDHDFEGFFKEMSNAVYPLMVKALLARQEASENKEASENRVYNAFPQNKILEVIRLGSIDDMAKALNALKQKAEVIVLSLANDGFIWETEKEKLPENCRLMQTEDCFLFFNGHDLHKNVNKMFLDYMVRASRKMEKERLLAQGIASNDRIFGEYPKTCNLDNYENLLKSSHNQILAFRRSPFLERIQNDIRLFLGM